MATRRPTEPNEDISEDEDFSIPDSEKPRTGCELYPILMKNGLIGFWKDRTDIGDTLDYVQKLKDQERERQQARLYDGVKK